ncbi:MAG TPA: thiamine ABC transporter substrate-binding protein [Candidatus Thermoplasmatota archaeon]|nr:thiamine ABC transporter substrate-binding protein [Candidatus Thermoplasmatota archaeon]
MRPLPLLCALLVAGAALAGCASPADTRGPTSSEQRATTYRGMGFDGETWPRLDGVTLTILDHGAFGAFEEAKALFENLTGAKVEHLEAADSGSALNRAVRERGAPTFDVIYGIDNVLWTKALQEGIFEPYTPLLSGRVASEHVFFTQSPWPATPVDHGYIAVNVDTRRLGADVTSLDDLRAHAREFVTQDPRTSTPGLGFLLVTIAAYGEPGWQSYWSGLFENGLLVTSGWTEAYEQHFSGGYGVDYGGRGDRAIVTSYTTSPAYEAFFGREPERLATPLVADGATFRQVETMGIAKGTKNLPAAQAWIEFTLTDEFQALLAPGNAVYPVVPGVGTNETFGGVDPAPGSFAPAELDPATIGANLERWLREWTDLCERHDCA